ncbi:MAG: DUF547 domain-containing protein [Luteitalea sp.]|nr:DUF547 domain-containing protein [Luteitalea sp.]
MSLGMMLPRFALVGLLAVTTPAVAGPATEPFDHDYSDYAALLGEHVVDDRVDYTRLKANRAHLDRVVASLNAVRPSDIQKWSRAEQLAFWINAYNIFTLRVIVDHYPINGSWFSLYPRNSIRQIDGVWTKLTWQAAGRRVTLDDIEHGIIRREFAEPRIHFAVNCASVSCPPLAIAPYRAAALDQQLDDAARRYLTSPLGLVVDGTTLRVSSIFKWYGKDFVAGFAAEGSGSRSAVERATLGVVGRYGPREAATLAARGQAFISYLDYDWTLNDIPR